MVICIKSKTRGPVITADLTQAGLIKRLIRESIEGHSAEIQDLAGDENSWTTILQEFARPQPPTRREDRLALELELALESLFPTDNPGARQADLMSA